MVGFKAQFGSPTIFWSEANNQCYNLYKSQLASIHSEKDINTTYQLRSSMNLTDTFCWIGLNDIRNEGNFSWIDETYVNYTNWKSGEPNNYMRDEHCVSFHSGEPRQWNDAACWSEYTCFICNIPVYDQVNNSKFTIVSVNNKSSYDWDEANEYCNEAFGTQLASIAAGSENDDLLLLQHVRFFVLFFVFCFFMNILALFATKLHKMFLN